jgi:soluble lytic murein transglycosylase
MNAESALDPSVTSPAGARGLMQLMPELAATLHADRDDLTDFDPNDLYEPDINASYGLQELTSLRARMAALPVSHIEPLVIAGYNGGEDAVLRWVGLPESELEADMWAETIGYTETRRYVRRVLGYLQTYRIVYGDGPTSDVVQTPGEQGEGGAGGTAEPAEP